MSYEIQPSVDCENCIKCSTRPVIDEGEKGGWEVKCPNEACKNVVAGTLVDIETWNRINKKNVNLNPGTKNLAQSA